MIPQNPQDRQGFIADCVLAPAGLVLAVCDEASAFNRPTINSDAWASTTLGHENRLWQFNSYFFAEMTAERAIVWILLLWGVYRLRVRLHEGMQAMPPLKRCELLLGNGREAVISSPTGRLGWMDVESADQLVWRKLAVIPPGRYLARLTGEEGAAHWGITDPGDYPPGDEDWVLHLAPHSAQVPETPGGVVNLPC